MNDIEALIKATIQTKVIEAFNTAPEVVEKLVQAALSKEVNEHGGKPDYRDQKMPFLDYLVGEEIRNAVRSSVREYVAENKEAIVAKVRQAMESGDLTAPLSKAIGQILSEDFRWNVDLKIERN